MSNTFSSPKAVFSWIVQAASTGFGIKVGADSYNRMRDNQTQRTVQKGVNRKILTTKTKKIKDKSSGIENPELLEAIKTESKKDYQETITEHVQTGLELGDSCRGLLQDVKIAGNFPANAEKADLYHVKYRNRLDLPGNPPTEHGIVLEWKDKNEKILEGDTLSTVFEASDKSKATSHASIKLHGDTGKGAPSSFASIANSLPWNDRDFSVTLTTLDLKTGAIEERVLSREETQTFQGILPDRDYVPLSASPKNINIVGIVLVLVAFSSLIGLPILKSLKKKFFFSEK